MKRVLLVGCGHMGSALLNEWINLKSYSLTVIDPLSYNFLKKKYYKKKIRFFDKTLDQNEMKKFHIIIERLVYLMDLKKLKRNLLDEYPMNHQVFSFLLRNALDLFPKMHLLFA